MSELDYAMLKHMEYLVESEQRPFTYIDFLSFEVDGKQYTMSHGTFRNKISKLVKSGKVELSCNSGIGFYNLRGHKVGKAMTRNHTMTNYKTSTINGMFKNLPLGNQCIHNIRLRFKVPDIWMALSSNDFLEKNQKSQDISLPDWYKENTEVQVSIHKTDTVSIIVSCSQLPISLDSEGIIRLSTILARTEELVRNFVNEAHQDDIIRCIIPDYKEWTITMWHFGRDSLIEYSGEKFSITMEQAQGIMTRIYSKDSKNGKRKIRMEIQEYPRKSISEAIQEKILISTT